MYYELAFKDVSDQVFILNYLYDYNNKKIRWTELVGLYETTLEASPNNPKLQGQYGALLVNCLDKKTKLISIKLK